MPSERARVPGLGRRRHARRARARAGRPAAADSAAHHTRATRSRSRARCCSTCSRSWSSRSSAAWPWRSGSAIAAAFLINYYFVKPGPHARRRPGRAGAGAARLPDRGGDRQRSGRAGRAARPGGGAGGARRPRRSPRSRAASSTRASRCTAILERARNTLPDGVGGAQGARAAASGRVVDEVGWAPPGEEAPLRFDVPMGRACGWWAAERRSSPRTSACCRRSRRRRRPPTRACA